MPRAKFKLSESSTTVIDKARKSSTANESFLDSVKLLLQLHQTSDDTEKEVHRRTAATNLMESACVDHMFVVNNPTHFQCSDNWIVKEFGPPARDKAEAMERVRV